MFLTGFTPFSVLLLFPLSIIFFFVSHDFDAISTNIVEVLSINPFVNEVTQFVEFPTQIPDCDSHSATLSDLFNYFGASICPAISFPPLETF